MDSLTQFAFGACVGVAVLGRRIGPRRAALTGGLLGTLPDLDVFLAPDDPLDSFVQHRGWSHSLFVHAALTPIIGEAVRLGWKTLHAHRLAAWAAVFLCLTTHALLDAATIYGTRLFWPFWSDPIGVGSIFIIDPLYTLPLLVAMIWAFCLRSWTPRYRTVLAVSLGLSTAYLAWTAVAQQIVDGRAATLLAQRGITPERMIATPTPFNTVLWRVIAIDGDRSLNLYMPVVGGEERAMLYAHDRNLHTTGCATEDERVARVAWFSRGFYRLMIEDDEVSVADLRMGLTPNYVFRFALGKLEDGVLVSAPTRRAGTRGDIGEDLDWLFKNLRGEPAVRLAEADALVASDRTVALAPTAREEAGTC